MPKRIITRVTQGGILPDGDWLDLENLAQVELTSEDTSHPIESALKPGAESSWRASEPGQQNVRLFV
ncbi:Carbohydrate-binding protein (fragment) [Syntrophobacter sp. SbD1]